MKWLMLVLSLASVRSRNLQQTFVAQPESLTVREGETVILRCGVSHKEGVLQWTKDDFGLGTSRSLPGYSRMSMVGGDNSTWDLRIENITLEEDGRYQCQVGATATMGPIRSEYAVVTVVSPPPPPELSVTQPTWSVEEGGVAKVECISGGGHPAAMLRWRLNGELVTSGISENVTRMGESKKMVTVSTLTFPVTINLSGSVLVCEAMTVDSTDATHTTQTQLQVDYKPKVTLSPNKRDYAEGEQLTLECSVDARPEQVTYTWFLGGQEIKEAAGAVELVIDVSRDLHQKSVSCLARNSLGQSSADYRLDVKYGPRFVVDDDEGEVTGEAGDRIILQCQVDSNPPPQYRWIKDGDIFEIVGTGPVLSFSLSSASEGVYTCQALATGYSPLSKQTQVTMLGPPVISETEIAQYGAIGDTVQVHCETRSAPDIAAFIWRFNGEELDKQSPALSIVESRTGNKVKSTVVIKNAQEEHFGEYYCAVENELGQAEAVIRLQQLEPLPLLIILSGTISALLLSIVVLVLAVTCKKMVSKGQGIQGGDISAWPRQPHHGYDSSSDEPSQSNITSSLTVDDPDDSFESLPVNYSAFIKSENIPDVKSHQPYQEQHQDQANHPREQNFDRDGIRRSCSYIVYNHYTSDQEMLHHSNPYVQSTSPMPSVMEPGQGRMSTSSPFYSNITPYKMTPKELSKAGSKDAVIRYLEGEVSAKELDDIKLGTHV